jgi:hypothetical protein
MASPHCNLIFLRTTGSLRSGASPHSESKGWGVKREMSRVATAGIIDFLGKRGIVGLLLRNAET